MHDIDDKITMHNDLAIQFTRDKGKNYRKYDANVVDGQCIGYVQPNKDAGLVNGNCVAGAASTNGSPGNEQPSTEASNTHTEGQNS